MRVSPLKNIILKQYPNGIEKLNLYETDFGTIEINLIKIFPRFRGSGIGSSVIKTITDYADLNDVIIHLTPTDEFGSNKNMLISFYKRFGFVKNSGLNKDFRTRDTMIRYPKINEQILRFSKWVIKNETKV